MAKNNNNKAIIIIGSVVGVVFFAIFFLILTLSSTPTKSSYSPMNDEFSPYMEGSMDGQPSQQEIPIGVNPNTSQPPNQQSSDQQSQQSGQAQQQSATEAPQSKPQEIVPIKEEQFLPPTRDYFKDALTPNVNLVIWQQMPISVYIEKSTLAAGAASAFLEYAKTFKGYISFSDATNEADADIVVKFVNKLPQSDTKQLRPGLTNVTYLESEGKIQKSVISVISINPLTEKNYSSSDINAIVMHEIGHALGINGHSTYPKDVMYSLNNALSTLSERDKTTIMDMYVYKKDIIKRQKTQTSEKVQ